MFRPLLLEGSGRGSHVGLSEFPEIPLIPVETATVENQLAKDHIFLPPPGISWAYLSR